METLTFKTNINCGSCMAKVSPFIDAEKSIVQWQVDTDNADKILTVSGNHLTPELVINTVAKAGYKASPSIQMISKPNPLVFWSALEVWKKASRNTTNCLIGCSIGDFGTIILFQIFAPNAPMALVMGLAMLAGLTTSVIFETILLHLKENFPWKEALTTAFSMSFLSMLAMELAENATDFMLTGGNVPMSDPFYWTALACALVAGFLVPLPYNYYKLKKYGKACH